MRRIGLVAFLSFITFAGAAEAQQQPPPGQKDRSNSQFTLNRNNSGAAEAEAARGKARAGDCAGALPLFDTAVSRGAQDPTVLRDRGICHDKLGNTFPAVEDYRAYLANAPDAPDREQIQKRLNELEPKTASDKPIVNVAPDENLAGASNNSIYQANREAPERKRSKFGPKEGEVAYNVDYYKEEERLDDRAERSSLRLGRGLVLAPVLELPRVYFLGKRRGGIGWGAAGEARYSFGKTASIFFEFGWAGIGRFRDETRQPLYATKQAGPISQLGFEARLSNQKRMDDQLFLRGGVGYERYVEDDARRGYTNVLVGRFAVGFRRVYAEALGFEFGVDGGPVLAFPEGGGNKFGACLMGTFALAFGL